MRLLSGKCQVLSLYHSAEGNPLVWRRLPQEPKAGFFNTLLWSKWRRERLNGRPVKKPALFVTFGIIDIGFHDVQRSLRMPLGCQRLLFHVTTKTAQRGKPNHVPVPSWARSQVPWAPAENMTSETKCDEHNIKECSAMRSWHTRKVYVSATYYSKK